MFCRPLCSLVEFLFLAVHFLDMASTARRLEVQTARRDLRGESGVTHHLMRRGLQPNAKQDAEDDRQAGRRRRFHVQW